MRARVACYLKKLGHNPALITRIGLDNAWKQLINLLARQGVCTDYFQVDDNHLAGKVDFNQNEFDKIGNDKMYPEA